MSMAVSDLSAVGAPSRELAAQLNSLFGPCAVVSIMAVCVAIRNCEEKLLRSGVYLFAVMEWLGTVGYGCFSWISDAQGTNIQNIIHILVTVFVVLLSIVSKSMIIYGTRKSNLKSLGIWSLICLILMFVGALGTNVFPENVFGIFERMSTFSAVIFNAVLGWYLYTGKFLQEGDQIKKWCQGNVEDKNLIPNGYAGAPESSKYIKTRLKEADRRIAKDISGLM